MDSIPTNPQPVPPQTSVTRFGTVAIVGRTNVGKSTFLNACLGEKLAIVSPLPQTTRDELLGVVNFESAQIAFTDTPGLHRPRTELGRRMNAKALDAVRSHDAIVFVTDVTKQTRTRVKRAQSEFSTELDPLHADDRKLVLVLPKDIPCVLVLNKVDLLRDKRHLLPLLTAFSEAHPFAAIVPTSMKKQNDWQRVLTEVVKVLPECDAAYAADNITDKPLRFFVREFIREQVMLMTRSEIPHAVAVTVDRIEQGPKTCLMSATIHVEKPGQRAILLGKKGQQIKELGIAAREELEKLVGGKVYLELFVRVTERWKDMSRQLTEMGYDSSGSKDLAGVLPPITSKKRTNTKPTRRKGPAKRPTEELQISPVQKAKSKKPKRVPGTIPTQRGASAPKASAASKKARTKARARPKPEGAPLKKKPPHKRRRRSQGTNGP